jgi:hypothetical protein
VSRAGTTLYHRTRAARAILANGFRDAQGDYGFVGLTEPLCGVFLATGLPIGQDDVKGDHVLAVRFDASFDVAQYAIVENDLPVREYLIPADVINQHAQVSLITGENLT